MWLSFEKRFNKRLPQLLPYILNVSVSDKYMDDIKSNDGSF
jgi:hypothetical protein